MKPNSSTPAHVHIGSFELDIQAGELHRSGFTVRLQEQPREILAMLLEHPGDVVTREELRRRLWPDHTFVDFDHGLNRAINKLREALEDDANEPQYIETLPRRGYRLIAPVEAGEHVVSPSAREIHEPLLPATGVGVQRAAPLYRSPLVPVGVSFVLLLAGFAFWFATHRAQPEMKQRRLTANPVEHPVSGAAISPDGKYLAYSDPAGIHVKLIETGETHTLTPQRGSRSAGSQAGESAPRNAAWVLAGWFPDGMRLLANRGEDKGYSIWMLSILGGPPRKLREGARANSVSPDGSLIAFSSGEAATFPYYELWVMGPGGEEARKIAIADHNRRFLEAVWAPDGRRIATLAWGDRGAIETHDLTGGGPILVASNPELGKNYGGLVWLSDERLIYPQAEPPPDQSYDNLWEIKVDPRTGGPAGAPRRITKWVDSHFWSLSATADKKRLAFLKGNPQSDVYVGELEAKGRRLKMPRRLTLDEHQDIPSAWTPDSKAVLFVSDRTGSFNFFKQALDEDSAEPLTSVREVHSGITAFWNREAPQFSPNGEWILYAEASKTEEADLPSASGRLLRMPAAGGPSQFVLEGHGFFKHCCARTPATLCVLGEWSADRKQLVLTTFDPVKGRGREVGKIDARLQPGIVSWDLSPDASRIAYSEFNEHEGRVRFLSLAGGTVADLVVPGWSCFSAMAWASDRKGLFVTSIGANATRIIYVDLQGRAYPLWELPAFSASWAVPSPDGRHLAILGPTWDSNAWMLENF